MNYFISDHSRNVSGFLLELGMEDEHIFYERESERMPLLLHPMVCDGITGTELRLA